MEPQTQTQTVAKPAPKKRKKVAAKKPQSRAVSTVVAQPPAAPPPTNMLQVIATAVMDPRCDVEKMRALLDMQRDIEERDAKKALYIRFGDMVTHAPGLIQQAYAVTKATVTMFSNELKCRIINIQCF